MDKLEPWQQHVWDYLMSLSEVPEGHTRKWHTDRKGISRWYDVPNEGHSLRSGVANEGSDLRKGDRINGPSFPFTEPMDPDRWPEPEEDFRYGDRWTDEEIHFMKTKTLSHEELVKLYPPKLEQPPSDSVTKFFPENFPVALDLLCENARNHGQLVHMDDHCEFLVYSYEDRLFILDPVYTDKELNDVWRLLG